MASLALDVVCCARINGQLRCPRPLHPSPAAASPLEIQAKHGVYSSPKVQHDLPSLLSVAIRMTALQPVVLQKASQEYGAKYNLSHAPVESPSWSSFHMHRLQL
jgi:hypothetical protein